jgi:hypothetical protein
MDPESVLKTFYSCNFNIMHKLFVTDRLFYLFSLPPLLPALPANVRLGWKGLNVTNIPAYYFVFQNIL